MEGDDIEALAEQPWEQTLDFLTADMPPQEIDIALLANRYRSYLSGLQEYDLSVPARAIRVCAALLKMKAQALHLEEEEEEEEPNPMDFEDKEMMEEDWEEDTTELTVGPDLDMPVKQKPKRRMQIDELKDALRDAVEVNKKREKRQQERIEMDQQFEMTEEDINDKLDRLLGSIKNIVSTETKEKVNFDQILEQNDKEEKIEKFKHILHLENDEKVELIQEEFMGDLEIRPEDLEDESYAVN
jgi:chromatin segregation and condensation protein Rec8/ScpA/Scc1 (kleisin family)